MSGQYIHCFNFPRFISRANHHPDYDAYGEHYEDDFNAYNYDEVDPM
jgi:hypothetical protein